MKECCCCFLCGAMLLPLVGWVHKRIFDLRTENGISLQRRGGGGRGLFTVMEGLFTDVAVVTCRTLDTVLFPVIFFSC